MELKDKVVVITGGAGGLGLAMAQNLAAQGAKLALIDVDQSKLEQACADLGSITEVQGYALDITDEEDVVSGFKFIVEDFGQVNVLINNAGILRDGLMVKAKDGKVVDRMSYQQFQSVINVNLTGTFLCGREAAAAMIETGQAGVIINISSLAKSGNMGQSNYSASKAGVAAMSVGWAKELARYNIRSAAVAPGVIATEMTAAMKPEALERLEQMVPVGRLGQPEEIASTVRFIIENDYVNGRVFEIDGGIRL
ncbi:SDR family oxidoreductase [Shewanella sp. SR43-4]|jgi:3-oxoacyl-[acyl-carrier protein] reductase|uniref:SDR family oxidoreductase n=1 Tax=Shewanella vesiculosa TaxID=518738 RepID=A0ABV0FJC3_9GAMM|nr:MULTISPECIES: SDR family oxidoreductase [Shewanella]NCQ46583.1 SDR family oxidoreductase [Shewanella frigidimarina]MBB1319528.1 SDR family oxidoreductase [Shewanella sp. SR43-4]MBB1319986.1 SDR family oxidoreductase [Shewanella sp. SR43-8]MBB1387857.1 SDR family oxidoreductase [Shewanella sp. SG44-6]MBB1477060.1 SDR family oxidoreductase [Shewanella sp. SG41-3]|tara:strand:- start:6867 stop:7625 length:759 start_codon:yes stop_codon:yes gene_type:complete